MHAYDLDTFKLLDRYRYARSNFIAAYHGGSQQHRKRDLGKLRRSGLLSAPTQQKDSANYRYSPRVYELTSKSSAALSRCGTDLTKWKGDRNFWHQLMVGDIILSLEIACKKRNLRFRHRTEIIGDTPLQFKCSITHQFSKHMEHYDGARCNRMSCSQLTPPILCSKRIASMSRYPARRSKPPPISGKSCNTETC